MMTERIFMHLCDDWSVGYDDQQWIVLKRIGKTWRSIAFVGSTKRVLIRVLTEEGVEVTPEARAALNDLPRTFVEWARLRQFPDQRAAA